MKDHHLKAWLSMVENGSIRAAARALGLTQPAVTKAIRELEEELGTDLVQRSSRGVEVTEAGKQLTGRARLIQQQMVLIRQDIALLNQGQKSRVAVAVTPMVFLGALPQVLQAFRQAMPLADIKISEGLMPVALPLLREGAVDFCVVGPALDGLDTAFEFEPLQHIGMAVMCRRGHPLETATRWDDLLGCEWLMHRYPGSYHQHLLNRLQAQGTPIPQRVIETDTLGVSYALLTRSDALMIGPAALIGIPPYIGLISHIPVQLDLPSLPIGILKLRGVPLSRVATQLSDTFRRFMRD